MLARPNFPFVCAVLGLLTTSAGCHLLNDSRVSPDLAAPVPGLEPQPQTGRTSLPETPLPALRAGEDRIRTSSDSFIPVRYAAGRAFIPVEGVLVDTGFVRTQANASLAQLSNSEKDAQMHKLLSKVVDRIGLEVSLSDVFVAADVGYFSAWVALQEYPELKNVGQLPIDVKIAPVLQAEQRPHNSVSVEKPTLSSAKASFADFSGIERMGVSAFTRKVKRELGLEPTGQRVKVGVTDTGVTYGHPAFSNKLNGQSRVVYMKDFTSEGAGYVSSLSKISVQRQADNSRVSASATIPVTVNAEYLEFDALQKLSSGDQQSLPFSSVSNEVFLLPRELVELLEVPETTVRLGVVSELSFATKDEQVDVNGNGKTDDSFYFFHASAQGRRAEKVWIDFSGTGNFKASKALRDFNASGDVQEVLSERIGLSFTEMDITPPKQNDLTYKLKKVALVGFDPGNHGSHVAGIIGATKTLSNDKDSTLARGVAPDVSLMVNRVCANNSGCNATRAIIDLAQNGARIINMSLGGLTSENDGYGIQETIINRLTEIYDVLFVISAGNSGPGRQTVGRPSTARHALSVGATATPKMILRQYNWLGRGAPAEIAEKGDDDFVMYFSSRGPSAAGGFKPNISAPGTQLSVIQLNSTLGSRAGTDIYWGTSMAAPAAAGAAALLLDAALAWNEKNPGRPLPIDALTLRRVLMDSARPFQVSSFKPATGEVRKGIYSWIDQGYGMVDLPAAWELLKKKANLGLSTGVVSAEGSGAVAQAITPDYQVRVLRTMGNGKKYDGSQSFKTGTLLGEESSERKFGQGIWLNTAEADKLVEVHFSRKLPLKAMAQKNVGELLRQLNTSSESFELETTYFGSRTEWLKVGVPQSALCDEDTTPVNSTLTLLGAGALETPVTGEPGPALNPLRASSLFVCLRKTAFTELQPGDHAALIRAFRVVDGKRDALASFEVPVYMTVPHHSAALQAKFSVQSQIKSFMVDRHYVRVPAGVSVLRVALEVPQNDASIQSPCSAASLMVLKGNNTSSPGDLAGAGGVASNCTSAGAPVANRRVAKFTEMNPNSGIWDIHVLGRFQFPISSYKLDIDYATFAEIAPVNLNAQSDVSGAFDAVLKESTFDAQPDAVKSDIRLSSLLGRTKHEIGKDAGRIVIPSAAGQVARTYAADAGTVTITTTSIVSGLDIDVYVDECEDAELKVCKQVAESGNPASEERAVFLPLSGKFYAVRVDPYEVPSDNALFSATEVINAPLPEAGRLKIMAQESAPGAFKVEFGFDRSTSKLLQDELFRSGKYEILGECKLANSSGLTLVKVPVHVLAK